PIEHYEDYRSALAEKQSVPYRLGQALIKATKTWYKGGLIKLYFEINEIKRDKKR
ncbi:alpha-2,3-sialyltransferase, partial [Campylobacter hyointestinalis subsp. lawsonii]